MQEAADILGVSLDTVERTAKRLSWEADADGTFSREDVETAACVRAGHLNRGGPRTPTADSFTRAGAEKLAQKIRDYWQRRGRVVTVRVDVAGQFVNSMRTSVWYVVRSDMVNGRPPK